MNLFIKKKNDLDLFKDAWFNDFFDAPMVQRGYSNLMKTDIVEKENNYTLSIEMPGFNKDDIQISLEEGILTIEGNIKKDEKNDENEHYIRKERFSGTVSRSYSVSDAITKEDIKASFNNGVLTIDLPKKVQEKKETKSYITIE